MNITEQMARMIRVAVIAGPFGAQEMRRIEGLGELYISQIEKDEHDSLKYNYLMSVEVDGETYQLFGGISQ